MEEDTDKGKVEDAVLPKADEELSDEQLSEVAGGGPSVSYTPQKPDGSLD